MERKSLLKFVGIISVLLFGGAFCCFYPFHHDIYKVTDLGEIAVFGLNKYGDVIGTVRSHTFKEHRLKTVFIKINDHEMRMDIVLPAKNDYFIHYKPYINDNKQVLIPMMKAGIVHSYLIDPIRNKGNLSLQDLGEGTPFALNNKYAVMTIRSHSYPIKYKTICRAIDNISNDIVIANDSDKIEVSDINDSNDVIGMKNDIAFIYRNGSLKFIDFSRFCNWYIIGSINNNGLITASHGNDVDHINTPNVYDNGFKQLPVPLWYQGGGVADINDNNQMVGSFGGEHHDLKGRCHPYGTAAIWDNMHPIDLNRLVISSKDLDLQCATQINNRGQIVALSEQNGIIHSYLLTPK